MREKKGYECKRARLQNGWGCRERERERVAFREKDITTNSNKRKKRESKKRIGYLAEVQKGKKRIKLLQDSLSFL